MLPRVERWKVTVPFFHFAPRDRLGWHGVIQHVGADTAAGSITTKMGLPHRGEDPDFRVFRVGLIGGISVQRRAPTLNSSTQSVQCATPTRQRRAPTLNSSTQSL